MPTLHVSAAGDLTVARVTGCSRLDHSNADPVFRLLMALADGKENLRVRLDLSEVEEVSGSALGSVVLFNRWLRASGGRMGVANARPPVRELLSAAELDCAIEGSAA
jgi:anti-anti-sigma regulatory factor